VKYGGDSSIAQAKANPFMVILYNALILIQNEQYILDTSPLDSNITFLAGGVNTDPSFV
jgi:hypothetical protein